MPVTQWLEQLDNALGLPDQVVQRAFRRGFVLHQTTDRSLSSSVKYFLAFLAGVELLVMTKRSAMPQSAPPADTSEIRSIRLKLRLSQPQFAAAQCVTGRTARGIPVGAPCPNIASHLRILRGCPQFFE
jgi:hypothetical protein